MKEFSVKLPLPTRALSSNYRGHTRGAKAQETAAYRDLCCRVYKKAEIPVLTVKPERGKEAIKVVIDLEFFNGPSVDGFGRKCEDNFLRCEDEDGARTSFKAGQDALQDAGLIPNDSATYVKIGETIVHRTPKAHGGRRGVIATFKVERLPTAAELKRAKPAPAITPAQRKLAQIAKKKMQTAMKRTRG